MASFAEAMWKRCQLTWNDLKLTHRHGLGSEKIPADQIKSTIPSIARGVSFFLAFRFHGKCPMVGVQSGRVFHVLWLDRDFSLYKH